MRNLLVDRWRCERCDLREAATDGNVTIYVTDYVTTFYLRDLLEVEVRLLGLKCFPTATSNWS